MNVIDGKYMMKKGDQHTLFGLIGEAKRDKETAQSLSGIAEMKPSGKVPSALKREKVADKTEKHIGGKNATALPGAHFGQVPYPGVFMKEVGKKL